MGSSVPVGVRYAAGLDQVGARWGVEGVVADADPDFALDHVGDLIGGVMDVRWDQHAGWVGVLHDRERASGLLGRDLEKDSRQLSAFAREDDRARFCCLHAVSPFKD